MISSLRKWIDLRRMPVRLAIISFLAITLPINVLFIAANNRARELDELVAEGYITRVSLDREELVEEEVIEARSLIKDLVTKQYYFDDFLALLDTPASADVQNMNTLLRIWLVESGLYTKVTLFNPEGELVASTSSTDFVEEIQGGTSLAYRAAIDAQLLGESQVFVAGLRLSEPVMEIGQIIYRDDGTPAGYLIGTLNINEILLEKIPLLEDFIPLATYLVQEDGLFIAPDGVQQKVTRLLEPELIDRALEGESGVVRNFVGSREIIVHYTPLRNSPFVMFTETTGIIQLAPSIGLFSSNSALVAVGIILVIAFTAWLLNALVSGSIDRLRGAMNAMSAGNLNARIPFTDVGDVVGETARDFSNLRQQVREQIDDLERRIAARTRDIQATQDISRSVVTERDLQKLMDNVVYLIIKTFPNIYHAQVFLINDERTYAILRASTNEPGRKLLERGHRLGVGSISVIGQVTQEGRTVVAVDTTTSEVHRRNEFLPDTRAELATPLRVGDRIIGALDVQSKQPNSFTPDQVTVLQIMADQVAISIDNARLYQDYQRQLDELNLSKRQTTHDTWLEHLFDQRAAYIVREAGTHTLTDIESLRQKAMDDCEVTVGELTDHNTIPVVVPISLRGQMLGTVEWELPAIDFSHDKVQLAEELVSRLAVSLDNARLFQQSQRNAERERVVNTIAAKLTGQTDIDEILKTAVREVGQALRVPEVKIRLQVGDQNGASQNGHHPENSEEIES